MNEKFIALTLNEIEELIYLLLVLSQILIPFPWNKKFIILVRFSAILFNVANKGLILHDEIK